jgi:hypothetical protein
MFADARPLYDSDFVPNPSKYPPHFGLEVIVLVIILLLGIGLCIRYSKLTGNKRLILLLAASLCIIVTAVCSVQIYNQVNVWRTEHPQIMNV